MLPSDSRRVRASQRQPCGRESFGIERGAARGRFSVPKAIGFIISFSYKPPARYIPEHPYQAFVHQQPIRARVGRGFRTVSSCQLFNLRRTCSLILIVEGSIEIAHTFASLRYTNKPRFRGARRERRRTAKPWRSHCLDDSLVTCAPSLRWKRMVRFSIAGAGRPHPDRRQRCVSARVRGGAGGAPGPRRSAPLAAVRPISHPRGR